MNMFKLYVSHDLGYTFIKFKESTDLDDLIIDCDNFDNGSLRWYIIDSNRKTIQICKIYKIFLAEVSSQIKNIQDSKSCLFATDDSKVIELLNEMNVGILTSDMMITKQLREIGVLN